MNPPVNRPVFLFLRRLLKGPAVFIFRLQGFRVTGRSRLPQRRTAAILICNHAAFIDSVYLIAALRPRFTICGARPKYFEKKPLRFLMRTANILKVENANQFREDCLALLRAGELILIYPEMGRNPEGMGPFSTWAAEVALAAKVTVYPCYLYGTTAGQEGPKRLAAGEPVAPSGDAESLTVRFRSALEGLREGGAL